ncbi:chemotaxis protein CheW, partial [Singulisphaera rosea]
MHHALREILIFEVEGRLFGLPVANIRELVRVVTIVPLPSMPPIVEGIVNLRGEIVPVLDIRPRLGMPAKAVELSDQLIIARTRGRLVAVRVDRAVELMTSPGLGSGSDETSGRVREGSARVAKLEGGLAPILGLAVLFAERESDAIDAVLPRSETFA